VKELLYNLESLTPGQEDFHTTITKVMEDLKPHNDSEEKNDLPELEKSIGAERSKDAAAQFNRTKKFVPTR
jgi:hypothetical protein